MATLFVVVGWILGAMVALIIVALLGLIWTFVAAGIGAFFGMIHLGLRRIWLTQRSATK